jgi:drug/metabolite transporter (DMT)-like permease
MLLGLLGVLIFAMTLPMTRLAVGPAEAPQLPPLFVTAGRAAGAALLSLIYLRLSGARRPERTDLLPLLATALGTVVGFPLFIALALREVPAMHAAVITGVLPLFTAVVAAWHLRQRPSRGFWVCALLGCALVLGFAARQGGGHLVVADGLLLLAMLSAATGYVSGAQLSMRWRAEHVISWVLVISLPLTLPVALLTLPETPVRPLAWVGFAYVTVFSMWLGFFAWYRGLAVGGTMRVSQVQMVQPFLALLLAVPVLGEPLQVTTLMFAVAVVAVVFVGKHMPVGQPARRPAVPEQEQRA